MSKKFFVITKTPLRISFFGGGTDFEDFFKIYGGKVIGTTINKYLYVTIKNHDPLFNEKFRVNYSETERVNHINKIRNNIIRECLKLTKTKPPIYVSVVSDIPGHTGLGSSSSLAVGLLNALYAAKGISKKPKELAELACKIEIDKLKQPIGKQDQYLSAFGGFGIFHFLKNGKVKIKRFKNKKIINQIFSNSIIVWTKQYRKAKSVLKNQKKNIRNNFEKLQKLNQISNDALSIFKNKNFNIKDFSNLLDKNWIIKKKLSKKISSQNNDRFYDLCKKKGVLAGKILGAGGGGFFLFTIDKSKKNKFFNFIRKFYYIKCLPSNKGTEVIYKKIF